MNNTLGEALTKALAAKKNDYSDFTWKKEKVKVDGKMEQESIRMIDMDKEQLIECYNHCNKMLYNEDPRNLGRYNVLEEINDQINKCNIELLLRYYENSYKRNENRQSIPRSALNIDLRKLKANNAEIEDWSTVKISSVSENIPVEFHNISVSDLLDGCIGYLGAFDKKHLTMRFITKMGLWFTKTEEGELKANSNVERLALAKERLHLPEKLLLKFSDKGLSYHEMRAMLVLPQKQKYSDMTTEQLVTLKDKMLPRLQKHIDGHIFNWKKLQRQLYLVARQKGFNINDYVEQQ